jgi:hypothetical protein
MSLLSRCNSELIKLNISHPILPIHTHTHLTGSSEMKRAFDRAPMYELRFCAYTRQPIVNEHLKRAKEHAEEMMVRYIYQDALSYFDNLKRAYFSGDSYLFESAMRDLGKELTGR